MLAGLIMVALSFAVPAYPQSAPEDAASAPVPLVRIPFPQDDGTLTPYTFELGYALMTLVYDTLLWRDAEGVPKPWLARSVEPTADARRVTVRLVEGAQWHDGAPVTSADVAFTFSHVASRPHPRFSGQVSMVDRVETLDATTAVFHLREPTPGFLDQPLADLPILPRHLWQGLARSKLAPDGLPVGSGPYRLVEHVPDQGYRFEANPSYFRGPPSVSVVEVPVIPSADDTVRALERRDVDMVPLSLPEGVAERVDKLSVKVDEGPSYLGTVLLLDLRTAPFDRLEVRRAVARALDLGRISRAVGKAVPAERGHLHPASAFSSPKVLHTVDVAAARSVLAALGSPLTVLAADNDPVKVEAGRQVVQALRGAGASAELQTLPRRELEMAVGQDGSPPSFQAAVWFTPPLASYDPTFLRRLFGSDAGVAGFNYAGYRSPAFDDVARRVATTSDAAGRRAATADALAVLAAEVPSVPLFFADGAFAYRPSVYDGWVFVKGSGILDKRSFVDSTPAAPPARSAGPADVVEDDGGGGGLAAGRLAVAVLGAAGVLAVGATITSVRRRR